METHTEKYIETKDYMVSGEVFSLYGNEAKDILATYPQPENINKYYQSEDYISHTNTKKSWLQKIYFLVRAYTTRKKLSLIERKTKKAKPCLLDIGAGTGYFVQQARRKNWSAEGFEPSLEARNNALVPLNSQVDDTKTYDVITLWHVLEHLADADQQMAHYKKILAADGIMAIAVPNYKSFDASYYKSHWAGYDVPRHLWHFSRKGLVRKLHVYGMEVVAIKPMLWDAFYVSILSEKHKKGSYVAFVRAIGVGLLSNMLAVFTKEYSSNIFIARRARILD